MKNLNQNLLAIDGTNMSWGGEIVVTFADFLIKKLTLGNMRLTAAQKLSCYTLAQRIQAARLASLSLALSAEEIMMLKTHCLEDASAIIAGQIIAEIGA